MTERFNMKMNSGLKISFTVAAFALLLVNVASAQLVAAPSTILYADPILAMADASNKVIGVAYTLGVNTNPGAATQTRIANVLIHYKPAVTSQLTFAMPFDLGNEQFVQGQVFYTTPNCTGTGYAVDDTIRPAQMVNKLAYVPSPTAVAVPLVVGSTLTSAGCGLVPPAAGASFVPIAQTVDFSAYALPFHIQAR
jgi:hypothetical protein